MYLLRMVFAALVLVVATSVSAAVGPYSQLFVFGDSLSDNGNLYRLSDAATPSVPNDGVPGLPYYLGRFSNGPVAVEHLALKLGVPLTDFAVGGAKTGPDLAPPPLGPNDHLDPRFNGTGILSQAQGFAGAVAGKADPNALYVVWGGPNDFFQPQFLTDPNTALNAVTNLSNAVAALYNAGARHFLVPNMPDLGLTPDLRAQGTQASALATAQSVVFNGLLQTQLSFLDQAFMPLGDIKFFDTFSLLHQVVADSAAFGFSNVTDPCIASAACIADSVNGGPALGYLFWDGVHPTAAGHALLGDAFFAVAVPEPDAYVMLLAGLALVGFTVMRRRRAAASLCVLCATGR